MTKHSNDSNNLKKPAMKMIKNCFKYSFYEVNGVAIDSIQDAQPKPYMKLLLAPSAS